MNHVLEKLSVLMVDTYALYLKTQNYHWHVKGAFFSVYHALFDKQYHELAEAVDVLAERIVILGYNAPATFKEFEQLKRIKDGNSALSAEKMISELAEDHRTLLTDLKTSLQLAQDGQDEGTVSILSDRITAHEKMLWMLTASNVT